jgi:8-oxo-dGTP pyrophosphatase MutT (NUDIX family)
MLLPPLSNAMGKFCWLSAPLMRISRECGSCRRQNRTRRNPGQALTRELQEELAIDARPECYIASHLREVSARLIHLHAWWVPHFNGDPIARYHSQLRWCSPQEALTFDLAPADIPLLEAFIAQRDALLLR